MVGKVILLIILLAITLVMILIFDLWGQRQFNEITMRFFQPTASHVLRDSSSSSNNNNSDFPADFLIGTSSSAYQVEGGWRDDGKSASIWDRFIHENPDSIIDRTNADIGPDSYHHMHEDVEALKLAGHYRFSISWTRLIPNGTMINQHAVDYYSTLIDALIANNIIPVITLFHWDLPLYIENLGGATNPIFVDYFRDFADVVFKSFGSRVKIWITINEPYNFCNLGYGRGTWAPGVPSSGIGEYLCGHYLLMAHAAAFRLFKDKYFGKHAGKIGITLDSRFYYAKDSSVSSKDLHRAQQYRLGWFAHPIFSTDGGYPQIMIDEIDSRCKIEGRPFSRLPQMSETVKNQIRGSSDFFGLNYYTSNLLQVDRTEKSSWEEPAWFKDSKNVISIDPSWKRAKSSWLYSVPHGLRDLLNWIKNEYNNPPVFITENGWSDGGELEDDDRIDYLKRHLKATSQAINEDQCNVIGYTAWSFLDSFEWNRGYTEFFGLFSVNYSSPALNRIPKKSVNYMKRVMQGRKIDV